MFHQEVASEQEDDFAVIELGSVSDETKGIPGGTDEPGHELVSRPFA